MLAHNASWLYRAAPYLLFATTWVAAALVPTYATNLMFSWSADLIAIVALLATGRFALALAGMDVGTAFGGIGSSREMMIASLAEPAMLLVVFSVALIAGTTQLSSVASIFITGSIGLRVSLGLALLAFVFVAIAENARIPIDNPATHLELTMVHEAMVLEYSGRHLAMIEAAAALKLVLYFSLFACLFVPFGMATGGQERRYRVDRADDLSRQGPGARGAAADRRDRGRQDARVSLSDLPRRGLCRGRARRVPAVRVAELLMQNINFDVAHLLAGSMLVLSFVLLYQDRITAVLNVFALQAIALSLSVAWQAFIQDAPHLFVTAGDCAGGQGHRDPDGAAPDRAAARHPSRDRAGDRRGPDHADRPGSRRAVDPAGAAGRRQIVSVLAREDLAFALAVILLGLLMMITRRNAVTQIVGFMSLENGLVLAATGAKGMPLVVEISVAFSVLIAFIVFGVFVFRIRERFDTVDVERARPVPRRAEGPHMIPSVAPCWKGFRPSHPCGRSFRSRRCRPLLLIPAAAVVLLALIPWLPPRRGAQRARLGTDVSRGRVAAVRRRVTAATFSSSTISTSIWSR